MLREKIDSWAIACPDRVAHRHRDQALTYAELKTQSDALAVWLHEQAAAMNVSRGTPVVVYGHKETGMLVAFLASIKAGYPYIPIDISVPIERVRKIMEASGAWLLLSPRPVPQALQEAGIQVVERIQASAEGLGAEGRIFDGYLSQVPAIHWQIQQDEVYYIIFTSGSTGVPKGVQITLEALQSFLAWVNTTYLPQEMAEVFLNQAPFSFDLSVMDLYMSLSTGGTLWSIDKEQIASPKELFASFAEAGLTFWVSTPSFAEVCLLDRSFNSELLPKIKRFLFCGEVLTPDCAGKLVERFPQGKVENLYGPTEATVAVTTLTIDPDVLASHESLPVGRVKSDALVLICNTDELSKLIEENGGELAEAPPHLPDEERGEIIIAGSNVSIGYLHNPEQTAKSFFSWTEEGKTWRAYRTGDAGIFRDGMLFYHGRLDFQVKLHGYRIELGDIEENLRKIEWIDNAVVLPVEKRGKVEYLQAFLTANRPIEDDFKAVQSVREELKEHLPEYMVPRRMAFLASMPMTPNGKVDRRALAGGK